MPMMGAVDGGRVRGASGGKANREAQEMCG